jgi:hypothetical protein
VLFFKIFNIFCSLSRLKHFCLDEIVSSKIIIVEYKYFVNEAILLSKKLVNCKGFYIKEKLFLV